MLTTGWSIFVSQKNLVSGDAVLFLRYILYWLILNREWLISKDKREKKFNGSWNHLGSMPREDERKQGKSTTKFFEIVRIAESAKKIKELWKTSLK